LMESVPIAVSTQLSPSSEATIRSATQEFLSLLYNHKVQYRVHKSPPLVFIRSQINEDHIYLSKIDFNIGFPPTSRSSCWLFSFWFYQRNPICIYRLPSFVLHALPISSSLTESAPIDTNFSEIFGQTGLLEQTTNF
jgi:hypothetical protein